MEFTLSFPQLVCSRQRRNEEIHRNALRHVICFIIFSNFFIDVLVDNGNDNGNMVIEGTVKGAEEEHVESAWVVPSFTADSMANEVARQSREVSDRAYYCILA